MRYFTLCAVLLFNAAACSAAPPPQVEISEEVVLDAFDGDARLTARHVLGGASAAALRRQFAAGDAAATRRAATALYEAAYPGIALAGAPALSERDGRVEFVAHYVVPRPLVVRDGYHELRVGGHMMDGARQALTALLQDAPANGYSGVYRLRVVWPAAVRADDVPLALTMDNPWFRYRRDQLLRGNVMEYQAEFALKPPAGADGLREQVRLLGERQIASIGVGEKALFPASLRNVPYPVADAYLAGREAARSVAASPAGAMPAAAGCPLLHAVLVAGVLAPPAAQGRVAALERDLAADPARDGVRRCVGEARYRAGDFAGTVALIEGGAPFSAGHSMNRLYAWALLGAGATERAVETMGRYDDARQAAGSDTVYDVIQHAALLRRAGHELPAPLRARLAARSGPFWPDPIARMHAGLLGADALLAQAAAVPGDRRAFALGEAAFHVGVARLAAGDRDGARRAFRTTLANGVHGTFEYLLAAGELHVLGNGAPLSAETSPAALQRAADDLEPVALAVLGQRLAAGAERARGVDYLRQAAMLGHRGAQGVIGTLLLDTDPEEAAIWNGALAERGDVQARLRIAHQLRLGLGAPRDTDRALALLRPIADDGEPEAELMLAMTYHFDRRDPAAAAPWYRKAAAHGRPEAMTNLADLHENGTGVPLDLAQALALYRQAARLRDNTALASIGSLYEQGKGVPADLAMGYTYYLLAERFGWRGNQAAALAGRLTEEQRAAARAAAARWNGDMPLPGL